jgi:hypothetical protein
VTTTADGVELLPFSKSTVTSTRIYYDIVYARSLEEAVAAQVASRRAGRHHPG